MWQKIVVVAHACAVKRAQRELKRDQVVLSKLQLKRLRSGGRKLFVLTGEWRRMDRNCNMVFA